MAGLQEPDLQNTQGGMGLDEKHHNDSLVRNVLSVLWNRRQRDREESIRQAHENTFEWIFGDCGFLEFLEHGRGCYLIHGKPASGKSTLMKSIIRDSRTQSALKRWAADDRFVLASHLFWALGTELQRSQEGFLRSFLLEILSQNHHLIPIAFPLLGQNHLSQSYHDLEPLILADLLSALRRLLSERMCGLNICVFIDGVDERSHDRRELYDLILEMNSAPNLKVVLTSWLFPEPMGRFRDFPGIRMDEYAEEDIRRYVADNLGRRVRRFRHLREELHQDLEKYIIHHANGVFLWVVLVVRSLLSGLDDYDRESDLWKRLRDFPVEMEYLYKFLWQKIELRYRERCSSVLRTMFRGRQLQCFGPLSPLQLEYTGGALDTAVQLPRRPLTTNDRAEICQTVEKRLLIQTGGLLQVNKIPTDALSGSSCTGSYVSFLHESLYDFLEYNPEILGETDRESFDVDTSMLASCLREAKVLPAESDIILDSDRVMIDALHCLVITRHLEATRARPYTAVLDQLNETISAYWGDAERSKAHADDIGWQSTATTTWSMFVVRNRYPSFLWHDLASIKFVLDPFLILSTVSGCVLYAAAKAVADARVDNDARTFLLAQMIQLFLTEDTEVRATVSEEQFNAATAIGLLLEHGANPNVPIPLPRVGEGFACQPSKVGMPGEYLKMSVWEYFLTRLSSICDHPRIDGGQRGPCRTVTSAVQFLEVFRRFLTAGADIHIRQAISHPTAEGEESPQISAATVLHRFGESVRSLDRRLTNDALQHHELDVFIAEFNKTAEMVVNRTAKGRILRILRSIFESLTSFYTLPTGLMLQGIVIGGSLVHLYRSYY